MKFSPLIIKSVNLSRFLLALLFLFLAGSYILVSPNSVDAANYSFTASDYSIVGNHIIFTASNFSHSTTTFTQVGTAHCNIDTGCIDFNSTGYSSAFADPLSVDYSPEQGINNGSNYLYLYNGNDIWFSQDITTPTTTPTPAPHIAANPSTANVTVGTPFTVDIVVDGAGTAFNAAQPIFLLTTWQSIIYSFIQVRTHVISTTP